MKFADEQLLLVVGRNVHVREVDGLEGREANVEGIRVFGEGGVLVKQVCFGLLGQVQSGVAVTQVPTRFLRRHYRDRVGGFGKSWTNQVKRHFRLAYDCGISIEGNEPSM